MGSFKLGELEGKRGVEEPEPSEDRVAEIGVNVGPLLALG